jgi:hypothetical protein
MQWPIQSQVVDSSNLCDDFGQVFFVPNFGLRVPSVHRVDCLGQLNAAGLVYAYCIHPDVAIRIFEGTLAA